MVVLKHVVSEERRPADREAQDENTLGIQREAYGIQEDNADSDWPQHEQRTEEKGDQGDYASSNAPNDHPVRSRAI